MTIHIPYQLETYQYIYATMSKLKGFSAHRALPVFTIIFLVVFWLVVENRSLDALLKGGGAALRPGATP